MKKIEMKYSRSTNNFMGFIFNALVMLVIGILLAYQAEKMIAGVSIVFGLLLIVAGVFYLIGFFRNEEKTLASKLNVGYGVISIIAGLVLVSRPTILANLFVFVIGIWITFSSVSKIRYGLDLKDNNNNRWKFSLSLGIVNLVLGIVFLIYSFQVAATIVTFVGYAIIFYAVLDIVNAFLIKDQINKPRKKTVDGKNIIDVEEE